MGKRIRLTPEERETILCTSDADEEYSVYTYDKDLIRRLKHFAKVRPDLCRLKNENKDYGYVDYMVDKNSVTLIFWNTPRT